MAIDYGLKRTGVAVTDPLQIIANPLETVASNELLTFLTAYIRKEEVECIVVGDPKNLDNTPAQISGEVNRMVETLRKTFPGIAVKTIDERFTSKIAQQTILASGVNKKRRRDKSLVDKISAVIILQSFLETI
jgi:putative Holliday junction resolvase